jgi:predicted RNA polymerase sigma factor
MEQDSAALTIFENLLRDHDDYLPTYYHCGKLYEKLNKKEEAIACYEKGILLARKQNHSRTLRELNEALRGIINDEL